MHLFFLRAWNGLEPAGEGLTIYRSRKCSSDESPLLPVEVTDMGIQIAITHVLKRTLSRNYLYLVSHMYSINKLFGYSFSRKLSGGSPASRVRGT